MAVTGSAKFKSLVTEFAAAAADLGHPVQEHLVAAELQQHITFAALATGVSEQWVLRAYCDDSWARDMARQMYSKIAGTKQPPGAECVSAEQRGRDLSVRSAARLVAGLGQALLYFQANENGIHPAEPFSLEDVANALTWLGVVIADCPPGSAAVHITGDVVACTRRALTAFADALEHKRWSYCPCGEKHGQAKTDQGVLKILRADLLALGAD